MQSGVETALARLAAFDATAKGAASSEKTASHGFFGADGLTFGDLIDTLNPLEHIPIVSTLYDAITGSKPSTAAKLAGGALLGGPVGFFASLAGVVFESATGSSVEETAIAMITGGGKEAPTQLASNDATLTPVSSNPKDAALLSLYGASGASAHQSYQQAQLRPYLKDVTTSQVI